MLGRLDDIARNLELRAEGLWAAKSISEVSFPREGHEQCFAVEDRSYWFQHRNQCIREVLRAFPPGGTFVDIGGGNGYVARSLQEDGLDVVLVEPGLDGVRNAAKRGVKTVVWSTLEDAEFLPGALSAAGLFDVLEHVANDERFLSRLNRLQPPGGRLYLTVPAGPALWSREDALAGHYRRYTLATLAGVVQRAGYTVEFGTYFFQFLWLPVLLARALPYRLGLGRRRETVENVRADHEAHNRLLRAVLGRAESFELARIARQQRSRIGSSCLLVARR